MKNVKNKVIIGVMSAGIALILAAAIVINVLAMGQFDNILEQFFRKSPDSLRGDTMGADVEYYKSDFDSVADLYTYEEELVAEIAQEGITLLKNDGVLPLDKGTELSLFGNASVDLVSGGSGSGSGSFELTENLKDGLESAGLKVNEDLWNFYDTGAGAEYRRHIGVINYGRGNDWDIDECPINVITADSALVSSFNDTVAMFVIGRTGGEGGDEPRDMEEFGGKAGQHYLEPCDEELAVIKYLDEHFEDVILLVNSNNAMELGWVADYPNISAVLSMPGAGRTGVRGLGRVLVGEDGEGNQLSPSGHITDTFVYDNFSSPAMQNMGDYRYDDGTQLADVSMGYYYVNYAEGIYVGYKYYETRYEDVVTSRENVGTYDYNSTVLYPFGYGLSYTTFTWSDFTLSDPDANGKMTASVTVTNTGDYYGKDVVQLYVQSPYTDYDVENSLEKASVSLVGFAKTKNLAPDESETLTVTLDLSDFISYDTYGYGTYILEEGTYYVTAASDAHKAVNNVLAARIAEGDMTINAAAMTDEGDASFVGTHVQKETDAETYSTYENEGGSGKIENRFDDYSKLEDTPYLSRSNWSVMENNGLRYGTPSDYDSPTEIGGKQFTSPLDSELKAKLDSQTSLNPNEGKAPSEPITFGADNDVDLIDLRGLSYYDPLWEKLLDEINVDELSKLIAESGYCSPAVDSINKPKVTDLDGPAGLNEVVNHGSAPLGDGYSAMTWPTEYLIACTWNVDLSLRMGQGIGEDGLYAGVTGWYGPAVNIHRTPFAGRNFEYYSEDSFLSGTMGRAAIQGAAQKGMYAFLKHFALNDQEIHRDHLGLITWAGEQAIREIYLKPFEMCLKDNTVEIFYNEPQRNADGEITGYEKKNAVVPAATAIMSSFNRIGPTWAGGNYDLLTGVLREEWGFNGFVLTDYEVTSYMHTRQALAAGGDAKLTTVDWSGFSLQNDPEYQAYGREAAHHILYTVVHSAGMNGYVHGVEFVPGFAYYKIIIICLDVVAAAGIIVLAVFLTKRIIRTVKGKAPAEGERPEGEDD